MMMLVSIHEQPKINGVVETHENRQAKCKKFENSFESMLLAFAGR